MASRTLPRLLQLAAVALVTLWAGHLSAQTVGGRLLDASSGTPIPGGSVLYRNFVEVPGEFVGAFNDCGRRLDPVLSMS